MAISVNGSFVFSLENGFNYPGQYTPQTKLLDAVYYGAQFALEISAIDYYAGLEWNNSTLNETNFTENQTLNWIATDNSTMSVVGRMTQDLTYGAYFLPNSIKITSRDKTGSVARETLEMSDVSIEKATSFTHEIKIDYKDLGTSSGSTDDYIVSAFKKYTGADTKLSEIGDQEIWRYQRIESYAQSYINNITGYSFAVTLGEKRLMKPM